MFLASETNLMLALAVVAGVLLLVAIATSAAAMRWLGRLRDAEQELAKADRRVEHAERRTFTVLNAVPVALVKPMPKASLCLPIRRRIRSWAAAILNFWA